MAIEITNPGDDEAGVAAALKSILTGAVVEFVPVTGSRSFNAETDNGKILECSNVADSTVTLTVPATMPKGFQCGVLAMGQGDVFIAGGDGYATNHSSVDDETVTSQMTAQYGLASVLVVRNTDGNSAEFIVKGDAA